MKFISLLLLLCSVSFANYNKKSDDILNLQRVYSTYIQAIDAENILWRDGTKMPIGDSQPNKSSAEKLDHPSLLDQVHDVHYEAGKPNDHATFNPQDDPGRIRYEPFFRKMYGRTEQEAKNKLVQIYWMPKVFGLRYPLLVTTINGVNQKFICISKALEALVQTHPNYRKYLANPGGTFKWRTIANSSRLSPHSFGMTIDINATLANYWQWDLKKEGKVVSEAADLIYRNNIPWEIVTVFEKYGFIWGGKWHHYDTMHFEYRPELFRTSSSPNMVK
ncbi:MAG: M15 family metallopeptidase [Gammaproteobacteria bacterium]|nr:M15 family metallopeptidase [Gammaproteobacteria bacterium]